MSEEWAEVEAHVATGKTLWIYELTKEALILICEHYSIVIELSTNIDKIRKTLSDFVKTQAKKTKRNEQDEKEKTPGSTQPSTDTRRYTG